MRLLKYKVNKFRSVKGTDWIEVDQWTCLVGVNESGKTNLLLPLWKFNPADNSIKMDLLLDYPRDEYSKIDENDGKRKSEFFIEVLFELTQDELNEFNAKYEAFLKPDESEESEEKSKEKRPEKIDLSEYLLIKKDYEGKFYIYVSDEKCEEKTDDLQEIIGDALFNEICELIPKFVYYSEYGNLDSDLYLPRVKEDLARIESLSGKERMKARTLKILFGYLSLDPDEILVLGQEVKPNNEFEEKTANAIVKESRNKQKRFAKIKSAGTHLSSKFREWWSQGDYAFEFNADGEYFRIYVSDSERPSPIELESRSKGLQWFFSFFLVFLAESKENHRDCILLLDEPGLSLHPNAQMDLIRFFERLSQSNQLIYTTHLPFLVDHNNLDRIVAVYTEKGLTKASNDISKADKEKKAIQPVNAAIGITASQSLLVGCDIVIVEGVSDQFYLTMIKNHLVSKGKFKPKKDLVFIPVGGAKSVKPVVSIIHGNNSDLPISLLDSDETGRQFQQNLKQGIYSNDTDKVIETDTFTSKTGSEIEDLIPADLIVDSFDRLFSSEDGIAVEDIDAKVPIIPQLKQFAQDNQISLGQGWKAKLSKKVKQKFKSEVTDDLESKWEDLFDKLQ